MPERISLDREHLARLVDGLKNFAREFGTTGRPMSYILTGNALINEVYLPRDPTLMPKIINQEGRLIRVILPFGCDTVETRTNARILGLKHNGRWLTAKILMRYSGRTFAQRKYAGSLFAEIRARRIASPALAASKRLFAPRVIAYDRQRGGWIVEEQIRGTAAGPAEALEFVRAIDLAALYGATAQLKPVYRRPSSCVLVELLAKFGPNFPPPPVGALWPEGLTHRDLRGNLLHTQDNRLCVIDWETAKVSPIASDLISLYLLNPALKPDIVACLRSLDPGGAALSPEYQLVLASMRSANRLWDRAAFLDRAQKHLGIGYSEAVAEYDAQVRIVREHLASLGT